jgi:Raf kinase inhibitor-like YbhB/YbcL family protein
MRMMSPAFRNNEAIPPRYSRDGDDINPPLHLEAVPLAAKSLVLIMDDPDAPHGTFTHWLLFNVDPKRVEIREDHAPEEARQGATDWGESQYGGPQPPSGEHRYLFRLYALDRKLNLPSGANRQRIESAMKGHILDTAEYLGRFAAPVTESAMR